MRDALADVLLGDIDVPPAARAQVLSVAVAGADELRRVLHYASGTNDLDEIAALNGIGQSIGVSAADLSPALEAALRATTQSAVFVDSGAFSRPPRSLEAWGQRLTLYARLAGALGPRLTVVCPDVVGDAGESRRLLGVWAPVLQLVAATGAALVVPLQIERPGGMLPSWEHARRTFPDADLVAGVPSNKAAATDVDVRELLEASGAPKTIHFLGLGLAAPRGARWFALARSLGVHATFDSNIKRAKVGKGRPLTEAEAEAAEDLDYACRHGDVDVPDYTDAIGDPGSWLGLRPDGRVNAKERDQVAHDAGLDPAAVARFRRDPTAVWEECGGEDFFGRPVPGHAVQEEPEWCWRLELEIERAWERAWPKLSRCARKARAWRAMRPPAGTRFEEFQPKALPAENERGHRATHEVAVALLDRAIPLSEDPDFAGIWQLESEEQADWSTGEDEDHWMGFTYDDIPDLLDVPHASPAGVRWTAADRLALAEQVVMVAVNTRWNLPRFLAEAIVEDMIDKRPLRLVAVTLETAEEYVAEHHSSLPQFNRKGLMYALGIVSEGQLVAVATAGTPTGRWADPHHVLELTRIASSGRVRGAASMLVARLIDLLPRSIRPGSHEPAVFVTYSLTSQEGSTYKALADKGLRPVEIVKGKAAPGGARETSSLAELDKIRWEAGPGARPADWGLLARAAA